MQESMQNKNVKYENRGEMQENIDTKRRLQNKFKNFLNFTQKRLAKFR